MYEELKEDNLRLGDENDKLLNKVKYYRKIVVE